MPPPDASRKRSVLLNKIQASDVARSNTLDFEYKVVCHETIGFFGFFRSERTACLLGICVMRDAFVCIDE